MRPTPEIPDSIWSRPDMLDALRTRDIAGVLRLVRQYAGASQTAIGGLIGMSQGKVSGIMNGSHQVTALAVFERVADGLGLPDNARLALGLAPRTIPERDGFDPDGPGTVIRQRVATRQRREGDDTVRRRDFVGLTGASLLGGILSPYGLAAEPTAGIDDLAAALTEEPTAHEPATLQSMSAAVANAKRTYQACSYSETLAILPSLLRSLRASCQLLDGDDRQEAQALAAEAHHVSASIMLKYEDKGMAWLAADRSAQAAQQCGIPLMVGSSARIVTHVLMDGGHHRAAASNASKAAERMDAGHGRQTDDDLSVYGALLLRGALAAARSGNRHAVSELLDEAESAGRRLGHEGNHMWTAFGPNNVLCHRVSIALAMGDAGAAIDYARRVSFEALPIRERKATVLLDTARAFLMWNKHERALRVLRVAEQTAPEEVGGRPATRRLVTDLANTAPASIRREVHEFAVAAGISA